MLSPSFLTLHSFRSTSPWLDFIPLSSTPHYSSLDMKASLGFLISALLSTSALAHSTNFNRETKRETTDVYGNVFKRDIIEKRAAPGEL